MKPTLFVSYSREDAAFVRRLYERLVEAGHVVWLDTADIAPGDDWWEAIERGLEGADVLVFVISPASLTSDVCLRELRHAVARGMRVVPLLHRDPDGRALPPELVGREWIAARDADGLTTTIRGLVAAFSC